MPSPAKYTPHARTIAVFGKSARDSHAPGGVQVPAGVVVFMLSNKGGQTREFLSEARFELRKVVWPTRQEATRTTWVVIAVVILLSLILAFFDVTIQAAVKWLLAR